MGALQVRARGTTVCWKGDTAAPRDPGPSVVPSIFTRPPRATLFSHLRDSSGLPTTPPAPPQAPTLVTTCHAATDITF